jgi:hypothetical protein
MRPRFLVVLLALALPAAAQAKEPIKITVCGESGCSAASPAIHDDPFGGGGSDGVRRPPPGPYYRLELDAGGHEKWSIFYVPAARALAIPNERGWIDWRPLAGPGASVVRRLARPIEPFTEPTVSEALLDSRPLPGDPGSYLTLLQVEGALRTWPEGESVPLELRSERPSPWTNISFGYYPANDVLLQATGTFVRLPAALVADLEGSLRPGRSEKAAPPFAERPSTGLSWLWPALAAGCGLLAAAGAILGLRRLTGRTERLA